VPGEVTAKRAPNMPPTTPTDPGMCSLCPRTKKAQHPKKLVRFDSIVDTFSISDSNAPANDRVRPTTSHLDDSGSIRDLSPPLASRYRRKGRAIPLESLKIQSRSRCSRA